MTKVLTDNDIIKSPLRGVPQQSPDECTYTITIKGTVGNNSAEFGLGAKSNFDAVVVTGKYKVSAGLLGGAVEGKWVQGEGTTGSAKLEASGKGGLGLVGGKSVSIGVNTNGEVTTTKTKMLGIGGGVDANGTGFYGAVQGNYKCETGVADLDTALKLLKYSGPITLHLPIGQVSSARFPWQYGSIPAGSERNALDVRSDTDYLSGVQVIAPTPNTPRPSDEAIQTSRDIVAGKLVDAFTGQIVYADAIIRGVAEAKKKREREIAEAAAWQREHNRDRQDGGSSSSTSGSSSNSNNGRVHIPPGTPNDVRLPGVSYGGQDADARREGGAHGTPTFDNHADRLGFPIVIDLDGDGVEISPLGGSTARFDYDNDGFKELTAWVGKDDGLLVYDIGNDGLITQTREVVIAEWTADKTDTDLDALKAVYFNAGRRGRGANCNHRPRLKAAA